MISVRPLLIFTACLPLVACVAAPYSRTDSKSSAPVSLQGYTVFPGQRITIQAVDQNTGNLVTRGTAISATSGFPTQTLGGTNYSIYPWSFDAGVLPANFWSPQSIVADLATSQGHLELFASADGNNFYTFSPAAWNSVVLSGEDPVTAGVQYSDGKSTVLFDQSGVGSSLGSLWVTVQGMISDSHSPYYSPVAWSVGYYTVEGGKKIYGLICAPTTGGPYPVVIYNHGGTDNTNGGNITGVVTAAGWTAQPPGAPDGLGQCLDWAKRGWVFATSSYRGEAVSITSSSPQFPSSTWTSDGNVEFCMGEVTDVMALTDLLVYHASAITVGSASEKVPINVNGKVLMYGYSHGGCITYRAVEQGAPVTAFSVIEGFTDLRLTYLSGRNAGLTPEAGRHRIGSVSAGRQLLPARRQRRDGLQLALRALFRLARRFEHSKIRDHADPDPARRRRHRQPGSSRPGGRDFGRHRGDKHLRRADRRFAAVEPALHRRPGGRAAAVDAHGAEQVMPDLVHVDEHRRSLRERQHAAA